MVGMKPACATAGLSSSADARRMFAMTRHLERRKQVRHYHDPGHVHELTFSCYQRWPLLTNDPWRLMLAETINRAIPRHGYRLTAFVFMPEHGHLIADPLPQGGTGGRLGGG